MKSWYHEISPTFLDLFYQATLNSISHYLESVFWLTQNSIKMALSQEIVGITIHFYPLLQSMDILVP